MRLLSFFAISLVPTLILFWVGPPHGQAAADAAAVALRIMTTIFSLFAGFLMGVIAMVGDHRSIFQGRWTIASMQLRDARASLRKLVMILYLYFGAISLAFASALVASYAPKSDYALWLVYLALSVGCIPLIWSFGLPIFLFRMLMERFAEAVTERKEKERQEEVDSLSGFGPKSSHP